MLGRKGRRFLRALKEGGKVLLSSLIGVLSLAVNFYLVFIGWDWSSQSYYDFYGKVITNTAATAAVLIAIVIYSPEVVKVFGETFLAKRFAAGREEGLEEGVVKGREEGREEGLEEGVVKGREEGVVKGREEGLEEGREERDAEIRSELRRLLAENPETFADQVKDWLGNGDAPRNGRNPG